MKQVLNTDFLKIHTLFRQHFFATVLGVLAALIAPTAISQSIDDVTLNVYKADSCTCCVGWIKHMDDHGFASKVIHPKDLNGVKEELGVKREWQSCHTAVTEDGYVFEGHVPSKFIAQFLASPPANALGLAVPGMPMGTPGMEMGARFSPYDIILMKKDGSSEIYAEIRAIDEQK